MDSHPRMAEAGSAPDAARVAEWIGPKASARWTDLVRWIDTNYPGVFEPDWLFAGAKYGWALRFRKSRSFCTLIPERGRFKVLLIFGGDERKKAAKILPELTSHARADYEAATTYHDGKWVGIVVDNRKVLSDVEKLLEVKRRPKGI